MLNSPSFEHHKPLPIFAPPSPQGNAVMDDGKRSETEPCQLIRENSQSHVRFNVYSGKPVEETLFIKEYRLGDDYIESYFDRQYSSSMKASPDHLIFLSFLTHSQKLLYILLCHTWGFDYEDHGEEVLKIWPTNINLKLSKLVSETQDLCQSLSIDSIRQHSEKTFFVQVQSQVNNGIRMSAGSMVYIL